MVYFPSVIPKLKKLPDDMVAQKLSEYKSAKDADYYDRHRCVWNMRNVCGYGYDAWPDDLQAALRQESRNPQMYNFVQTYVRGIVGNYIMNWFDWKFVDREDDGADVQRAVDALQKIYYSDKDYGKYKYNSEQCIWNGVVYRGIQEMIIDKSQDPRGRIMFPSIRPDSVIFDPNNISDDISRKSNVAYKEFYLTPLQMVEYFPHMEKQIRQKLEDVRMGEQPEMSYDQSDFSQFLGENIDLGSAKLCVQEYRLVTEKKEKVIDISTQTELPETAFPLGSEEDFMAKKLWAQSKGIDISVGALEIIKVPTKVLYTTVICKELGLCLESRKDERQTGYLPLYCWSFLSKHGKSFGVVDYLIDAQQDINKREMAKTKILTQTPIGGKGVIHPLAFGDSVQKRNEIIDNANDPASWIVLSEDAPVGLDLIKWNQGSNVNGSILQDEMQKMDMMARIASVPPAMQGMTERTSESGVLFGRKVIEANTMHKYPMETIVVHEHDKAEDWVTMAIKTYGGETTEQRMSNFNRRFFNRKDDGTTDVVEANRPVGIGPNGEDVVEADLTGLKRVEVNISQAKENDYMKQAQRELMMQGMQAMQNSTNIMAKTMMENRFIETMEYGDQDISEAIKKATQKAMMLAELSTDLAIKNIQMQISPPQQQMPGAQTMVGIPPADGAVKEVQKQKEVAQGRPPVPATRQI